MGLSIRQHVFTWGDKFTVWDECGNEKYYVQGEVFTFGKKLHVYDTNENEVGYIEQKLLSFMPCYNLYIGDMKATVRQEFTLFKKAYTVEGTGLNVSGDFFAHEYEVYSGDNTVGRVYKEWMTWGDCYSIDYADSYELLMLCIVLAIDASLEAKD